MRLYCGSGLLNSAINKLPFELHIPSYRFCGPGTKLQKRLERGDKGINGLDEACKEHDIAYSQEKDLARRHQADKVLSEKALKRYFSRDASFGEKIASLGVTGLMKTKVKLGMGLDSRKNQNYKQCLKTLQKTKILTTTCLQNIETCIQNLTNTNTIQTKNKKIKNVVAAKAASKALTASNAIRRKKLENRKRKIRTSEEKMSSDDNETDNIKRPKLVARKRKMINYENDEIFNKKPKLNLNTPLTINNNNSNKRKLHYSSDNDDDDDADVDQPFKKQAV